MSYKVNNIWRTFSDDELQTSLQTTSAHLLLNFWFADRKCVFEFQCAFNCGTLCQGFYYESWNLFQLSPFLSVSLLYVSIYGAKRKTSPGIVCFFLFYCQLNMICLSSNSAKKKTKRNHSGSLENTSYLFNIWKYIFSEIL